LSFPYASRILGPVGIGKVQVASSFAQYFALFAALGVPIYGMQEVAKFRHDKTKLNTVFSELVITNFIAGLLFTALYGVIIFSFPYFRPNIHLYLYAGLIILLGFSCIDWFYSGMEEFKPIAVRSVLIKATALLLLFTCVKTQDDYTLYLLLTVFSLVSNNLISFIMIRGKVSFVFTEIHIKQHLRPLFYISSTTIAASMYTILDTVLLGFLSTEKAVGLYTSAIKLCRITLPFITSIGVILVPRIAKEASENNHSKVQELLDTSFHFITFLSVPVVLGLFLLAPEFIYVFSGEKFIEAETGMRVLAILPLFVGAGYFLAFQVLVPGGKNKEMFLSVCGGLISFVLLSFLLVPVYNETGTAIANVCSEFVVTALYFYFVKKYFTYTYSIPVFLRAVKCALSFVPIVLLIKSIGLAPVWTLTISIIICACTYFSLQYFVFRDRFVFKMMEFGLSKLSFKK
jgi:O-antigen/teichoic acid export membrane protein